DRNGSRFLRNRTFWRHMRLGLAREAGGRGAGSSAQGIGPEKGAGFRINPMLDQMAARLVRPVGRTGFKTRENVMTGIIASRVAVIIAAVGIVSGCANTIRGMGQDTAQAVEATQEAGRDVDRAAR